MDEDLKSGTPSVNILRARLPFLEKKFAFCLTPPAVQMSFILLAG